MFRYDQQHQNQEPYGFQDNPPMLRPSSYVDRLAVSPEWILSARTQQRADPVASSFPVESSSIGFAQQQVASPPVFSNLSDPNLALQSQNLSGACYMDRPSSNGPTPASTVEDVQGRTSVIDTPVSAHGTSTYASTAISRANNTSVNSLATPSGKEFY